MNIYLLTLEFQGYNCYEGFVIAAHDKDEAIALAKQYVETSCTDNSNDCFEKELAQLDVIGKADTSIDTPGVLLTDFTAA